MTHITQSQAVELARAVAARNGDTLKEVPEKETVELLHGLCNAAIQHYIDSIAEGLPEPVGKLFVGCEKGEELPDWECYSHNCGFEKLNKAYKGTEATVFLHTRDQLLQCIAKAEGER